MIIEIMSRTRALDYSQKPHDEKAAIISIANHGDDHPDFNSTSNNGVGAVCRVSFNDVNRGATCIKSEDAREVAAFVHKLSADINRLIIHCEYGASRSPGVAAAIMMALTGDDSSVWGNPEYYPNTYCYRKLLEAFGLCVNEQELRKKIEANRNLYETEMEKRYAETEEF